MADKDIVDFKKSQFDIMVDMLIRSGMSKDDAIVKVIKDFEDEGMVLKNRGGMMDILAEKHFGKSYDKLTPKEIELLEENWDELISQRKQPRDIRRVNQGGIIGLRFGGDPRTEQRSQGITQLASHSGNDVIQSAILWAAGLPQFGSIDAVVQSLQDGSTDMNGLVNAYMDARTEMN